MVEGKSGCVYDLPQRPQAIGGEGEVYVLPDSKVVKIYKQDVLSRRGGELEAKIGCMVDHPPKGGIVNYMAWPLDAVYNGGMFCGFMMNELKGFEELKRIHRLGNQMALKLQVALNLAMMTDAIHKAGYIIGDFNPMNIGFNDNGNVCFFDADAFQFKDDSGRVYRCCSIMGGYVAPELVEETDRVRAERNGEPVRVDELPIGLTMDTDCFALATHIFQLMFLGLMPYYSVPEQMDTDNELQQTYQFMPVEGIGNYCFSDGYKPFVAIIPDPNLFPSYIMDLFSESFRMLGPGEHRPTAEDWKDALNRYSMEVRRCDVNPNHIYWTKAGECPYCDGTRRADSLSPSFHDDASGVSSEQESCEFIECSREDGSARSAGRSRESRFKIFRKRRELVR